MDVTLIANVAELGSLTSPLSVILGLDPRTHNLKAPSIQVRSISLTVGPRVILGLNPRTEDDGQG
ncbi:hypothetical protein SAMN05443582_103611 [Phyllobacterium sp. OV277]|nr:hypothetical protein SAMN05443582_103611 [Phyllobacterium sp. OV277]